MGNALMRIEVTRVKEAGEGVMLQTHMDMVGEKWAGVKHDLVKIQSR